MFVYHAPDQPADAAPMDPAQMQEVMGQWMQWAERVGKDMIDFGTPLAHGVKVTPDGTSPSTREVAGYSMIEAENMDAALRAGQGPPAPRHARRLHHRGARGPARAGELTGRTVFARRPGRHRADPRRGSIDVESSPGRTRFAVVLPTL